MNVKTRPAEWSAAAAAAALLIVSILGVDDPAVLTAIGIVIGAIPGTVTGIVQYLRKPPTASPARGRKK